MTRAALFPCWMSFFVMESMYTRGVSVVKSCDCLPNAGPYPPIKMTPIGTGIGAAVSKDGIT